MRTRLAAVVAIAVGCAGGRAPEMKEPIVAVVPVAATVVVGPAPPIASVASPIPSPPVANAPKTCREALTLTGVRYVDATPAHPTRAMPIVDPVMVSTPIHGVTYRYAEPPFGTRMLVDCRFALRLARASEMFAARGVREVRHLGAFEPRCVTGGLIANRPASDDCVPSTHALGMALDLAEFITADDTIRVSRDFVQSAGPTCDGARASPRDAFLKELVCALGCDGAVGTFSALLTPNYDAKHRTHVHVDLRPPSKAPWACGVDPLAANE